LSKNLTLSYNRVIYQIKTKRAAYTTRHAHVEVRETSKGRSRSNIRDDRWGTLFTANRNGTKRT
jgi:hypothetical protein